MAEVIKEKYSPILYADPYAKKDKDELQVYATQIIDGNGWRIAKDGRSYCIGPVKIVDGMAVPLEKEKSEEKEIPENGVTDSPPALILQACDIDEKVVINENMSNPTPPNDITHEIDLLQEFKPVRHVKRARVKNKLPGEAEIIKLHKEGMTTRQLGEKYSVSHMTIARILNGQKILV